VFLTNASVQQPLHPFDDYDDRSLIENCCIKEAKQQWDLGHPPQKTERAVQVHVMFTVLMFALATAYRLQCEQAQLRTVSFLSPNSPCWWGSSSKMCRQASGHSKKCWPNTGSQVTRDPYIGTSGSGFPHPRIEDMAP
jgi:hypothetical protein